MLSHSSVEPSTHDPSAMAARVIESAVELARAEVKLMLAHARTAVARTVGAILTGMLGTSAAQVALILAALSPAFPPSWPRSPILVALALSIFLSAFGTWLAYSAWRGLRGGVVNVNVKVPE